ncbi:tetratricopeptide repeat protein [Sphingomonas adhaesiva]|nr:hypothetical protein [Sphingomonas adhaesiva]
MAMVAKRRVNDQGGRRNAIRRRSRSEWTVRLALAVSALCLGGVAVSFSLAQVIARANPQAAYMLAPYDGRIAGLVAATLVESGATPTPAERRKAGELAGRALQQDPTAVSAVATLGDNAQDRGDIADARRWFGYASSLTRRDPETQRWMIEDAVSRGDIPAALRQYDIALRTTPSEAATLFPILAAASAEPAIRAELIRTLAARPQWAPAFLHYAAGNSPTPQSLASLFIGLRRAGVPVPVRASNFAINDLVGSGSIAQSWAYYALLHPGARRDRSRDPTFAFATSDGSVLDWSVVDNGSITATTGPDGFDYAASAGMGGLVLEQLQVLPAGTYELVGRSRNIVQPTGLGPYWAISCGDGRDIGRIEVAPSQENTGRFAGRLVVPADCPTQLLKLIIRSNDAVAGQAGRIERVVVRPAS